MYAHHSTLVCEWWLCVSGQVLITIVQTCDGWFSARQIGRVGNHAFYWGHQGCWVHTFMQARAKELRLELLNSARLAAHFEAHPGDLALLRHDKPLAKVAAPEHLRHLPGYLRAAAPQGAASSVGTGRGGS